MRQFPLSLSTALRLAFDLTPRLSLLSSSLPLPLSRATQLPLRPPLNNPPPLPGPEDRRAQGSQPPQGSVRHLRDPSEPATQARGNGSKRVRAGVELDRLAGLVQVGPDELSAVSSEKASVLGRRASVVVACRVSLTLFPRVCVFVLAQGSTARCEASTGPRTGLRVG